MSAHRCGTIALLGRPNTGKSTLLNRLAGERLGVVSPRPQTTRRAVRAIVHRPDCQYVFVDLPGTPALRAGPLARALERETAGGARDCDVVAFVVEPLRYGPAERWALSRAGEGQPIVAVVNKIDRVRPRLALLPFLERLDREPRFAAIVPVSARTGENADELLRVLRELLPDAPPLYPPEALTDRDERFFAAELVREKLFCTLGAELPYRCETLVDRFRQEGELRRIAVTIWVERASQRPIVLGRGGERLKAMASAARRDLEALYGGRVYLEVWVKVRRGWTEDERAMRELGYA